MDSLIAALEAGNRHYLLTGEWWSVPGEAMPALIAYVRANDAMRDWVDGGKWLDDDRVRSAATIIEAANTARAELARGLEESK